MPTDQSERLRAKSELTISPAEPCAALRKSTEDPRILGPMHACAAEQALNADDLTAAAREILDGLAALAVGALPAEEIRLLSFGARIAADLASLPRPARPPRLADQWKQAAVGFGDRALAITEAAAQRSAAAGARFDLTDRERDVLVLKRSSIIPNEQWCYGLNPCLRTWARPW